MAGTFGSKKGSTLGTEEVLRMPCLVQSRHYFLLKPKEENNYSSEIYIQLNCIFSLNTHTYTQKQVYLRDCVYPISEANISGGQERAD